MPCECVVRDSRACLNWLMQADQLFVDLVGGVLLSRAGLPAVEDGWMVLDGRTKAMSPRKMLRPPARVDSLTRRSNRSPLGCLAWHCSVSPRSQVPVPVEASHNVAHHPFPSPSAALMLSPPGYGFSHWHHKKHKHQAAIRRPKTSLRPPKCLSFVGGTCVGVGLGSSLVFVSSLQKRD
jgi:hypothetical protein